MFSFFRRLRWLREDLNFAFERINWMSGELEELRTAVEANGQVAASAVSLITGLADKLEAALKQAQAEDDDAPIHDLVSELRTQSSALADAVSKNTPAAPPQQAPEGAPPADNATGTEPATGDLPADPTKS